MTLWSGGFDSDPDELLWAYTVDTTDRRLLEDDVRGSMAHVGMLAEQGLLAESEAGLLLEGLGQIYEEARRRLFRLLGHRRRRPHGRRTPIGGDDRRPGQETPHGPVAQRSGRPGPSALPFPVGSGADPAPGHDGGTPGRQGRGGGRHGGSVVYPSSTGPSRAACPPLARLRGDVATRRGADGVGDRSDRGFTTRCRSLGRKQLASRSGRLGASARMAMAFRELDGRRRLARFRRRVRVRVRPGHDTPFATRRRGDPLGYVRVRLGVLSGFVHDRLVGHAAEEESGCRRTGPRSSGRRDR